jgi:aconitase A
MVIRSRRQPIIKLTNAIATNRRKPMNRNTKQKAVMRQTAIAFIACAGLLTANVVSGDAYQDALKEAENESPHQRELQERSRNPYEEDLQENQRERP